jgi:hypothetical protein
MRMAGWLGTYFATHPNYKKSVTQNAERLCALQQKAKGIEHARQRDWL